MVLAAIGILDEDVVDDYAQSAPFMIDIRDRMTRDPETAPGVKDLPDLNWDASAESMAIFLSLLRRQYGSANGYPESERSVELAGRSAATRVAGVADRRTHVTSVLDFRPHHISPRSRP